MEDTRTTSPCQDQAVMRCFSDRRCAWIVRFVLFHFSVFLVHFSGGRKRKNTDTQTVYTVCVFVFVFAREEGQDGEDTACYEE